MNSYFDKLNLRPQERRLVVLVGLIVFVVLNIWFVRPHFKDWKEMRAKLAQAEKNRTAYKAEIARMPGYETKLNHLKSTGSEILSEELQLQRIVQTQASSTGVLVTRYTPNPRSSGVQTNQFFEEQLLSIDFNTGANELVNFLVSLASANSMIRVREMNLKPDPSQTKLVGTITFVANYQKKSAPAKPAALTARKK
ncbi:MAG: type II secretion system protein M [Chloroflexi bacterium]|nr:type II secretion system protein M [Chloroflexota bacterium]